MNNQLLQDEVKELEEQLSHKKQMLQSQGGVLQKNIYLIPLAIIIAGAFIGGGLALGLGGIGSTSSGQNAGLVAPNPAPDSGAPANITLRDVTKNDHIRGNANAPLTIVEYSDLECPFCKRFHPTMQQVMKEYDGKVRWVYRHFPLDQLHSKARKEAEATECANELGGNEKFWAYVDQIFEVTPSNNNLDPAELSKIAEFVKLDVNKFTACLSSGKYATHVADDLKDALSAGAQGTPYSVLINAKGEKTPISGAYPFENVKSIIDANLK